jgi:hypothetical protein
MKGKWAEAVFAGLIPVRKEKRWNSPDAPPRPSPHPMGRGLEFGHFPRRSILKG